MGSASSAAPRTRSPVISTDRLRIRSTQAPAGRPMSRKASVSKAVSSPIWNSSAASTVTANNGSAMTLIWVPSWLTVSPAHSWRKSRPSGLPTRLVRYQRLTRPVPSASLGGMAL